MESRLGPRVNINLKIISEVDKRLKQKFALTGGERFETTTFNISTLGIGMFLKYFLPKELILELEIDGAPFGLREIMKIEGEVEYCKYISFKLSTYKCGIKFLNIPEAYKNAITQFISTHSIKNKKC